MNQNSNFDTFDNQSDAFERPKKETIKEIVIDEFKRHAFVFIMSILTGIISRVKNN